MKVDVKGIFGTLGTAVAVVAQHWSEIMSGVAATATAVYMSFHAIREYQKWRSTKKTENEK